jgi:putative tryptophan/tyrosine transport system substrate-binding protein
MFMAPWRTFTHEGENPMRRRDFVGLVGGAAAWPLAAAAQQGIPVIGYLDAGGPDGAGTILAGLRKGLSQMGYVEGRNIAIEYRWANNQPTRIPGLVTELVHLRVNVVVTPNLIPALQAKATTTTLPIVFMTGSDPVGTGLVASLNRPGGNVTGVTDIAGDLGTKKVGLLHELLPRATRFAVLADPIIPLGKSLPEEVRAAAASLGLQVRNYTATDNREIDSAFVSLVQDRAEAVLVAPAAIFQPRRAQLSALTVLNRLPAIYPWREFIDVGGLMSYGANWTEVSRQVGLYTGRILKGEKPADLPVMQPTKFEFVINLQTARTLGIEVPPTLLAIADEVIE